MSSKLGAIQIAFVPLANADYSSCILENVKGVGSDVAAEEIKEACRNKYPEDKQLIAPERLLKEVVAESSNVALPKEPTASSLESPLPPEPDQQLLQPATPFKIA